MELLISFPDQSLSFTYGVEFGRILERIERQEEFVDNKGFPVRIENVEVLKKTCALYGYTATFGEPYLDGWIDFIGIKKTECHN